jgi:cytochrome c oxidase subunit 3
MLVRTNKDVHSTHHNGPTTLFHLVDLSPWPFISSTSLFIMLSGAVLTFNGYMYGPTSIKIGAFLLVLSASLWWRDVTREGFQGQHTTYVSKGIKIGFSLFIVSEIFLFIAFFWALFHSSLVPNIELGNVWPPMGIEPINPWVVPLLNAIILLSSGVTVTWSHHAIIAGNYSSALYGLIATITLAIIFTALMVLEYYIASFDISDSVYGSCFYMLTGLHGSHILVAIAFLGVSAYRLYKNHFSNKSFLGAELGILYYHFVDVVFLFVFGLVYWWSSGIELTLDTGLHS